MEPGVLFTTMTLYNAFNHESSVSSEVSNNLWWTLGVFEQFVVDLAGAQPASQRSIEVRTVPPKTPPPPTPTADPH